MILEEKCSAALAKFFTKLEKDIHKIIDEYWESDLGYFHLNKISDLITLRKQEYYDILFKYCKIQYDKSRKRTKRIYDRQLEQMSIKSSISITTLSSLFNPDPAITYNLNNKIFTASHHTMNRVDNLVMNNLSQSYNDGLGIEEAKNRLTVKYNGLKSWEAARIARTEINSAQNDACYDMCNELGCEYIQWWTAQDERVRDGTKGSADHRKLHGKIVKIGTRFSNGLLYPGDREGSISEWINCRCTSIPYLIPLGMMVPPDMVEFTEDDLIPIPSFEMPTLEDAISGNYNIGIRQFNLNPSEPLINSNIISDEIHKKSMSEIEALFENGTSKEQLEWYKKNFLRTYESDVQWQEKLEYIRRIERNEGYVTENLKKAIVDKNYRSKIDDIENILKRGNSKDDELRWYKENFKDKQDIDQWREKYDYLVSIEKKYPIDTKQIREEVSKAVKEYDIERLRSIDERNLFKELEIKAKNNTLTLDEEKKYKSLLKYVEDKNIDIRFVKDYNIKKGSNVTKKIGDNEYFTYLGNEHSGHIENYRVYSFKNNKCEIWVSEDSTISTENLFKLVEEAPEYIRNETNRVIFSQTNTIADARYMDYQNEVHISLDRYDMTKGVPNEMSYAYVHEFGHKLDSMLGDFTYNKKLYTSLFKGDHRYMSFYGETHKMKYDNYSEDFADTFSYVKRNPEKYSKEYGKRVQFVQDILEEEIKTPEEFEKFVAKRLGK